MQPRPETGVDLQDPAGLSAIPITLHLEIPGDDVRREALIACISERLVHVAGELIATLGLSATPEVSLAASAPEPNDAVPLAFTIHHTRCFVPAAVLAEACCSVRNRTRAPLTLDGIRAWLAAPSTPLEAVAAWVGFLLIETIRRQPSLLLDDACARELIEQLVPTSVEPATPFTPSTWRRIFAELLDLGVALVDRNAIKEALARELSRQPRPEDLIETLTAAHRPSVLEIRLNRRCHHHLTSEVEHKGIFQMLSDGLFYELGLRVPPCRFVLDESLPEDTFVFRFGPITGIPHRGLSADVILVNEPASQLAGLAVAPALNPANGFEISVVPTSRRAEIPAGSTTWTPLGYLILCVAGELRSQAARLVHTGTTSALLDGLRAISPRLVDAVRASHPAHVLTRMLRALATEGVSLRDFTLILEAALECEVVHADTQHIAFGDFLPWSCSGKTRGVAAETLLASFARIRLRRYLSQVYRRGSSTLVVFLVSRDIEQTVSDELGRILAARTDADDPVTSFSIHPAEYARLVAPDLRTRICSAVAAKVASASQFATPPAIVTTAEVRPWLHALISNPVAPVPVLAYQELSPETNIQPADRIVWNE